MHLFSWFWEKQEHLIEIDMSRFRLSRNNFPQGFQKIPKKFPGTNYMETWNSFERKSVI